MQLSFNVIKNDSVIEEGKREICTEFAVDLEEVQKEEQFVQAKDEETIKREAEESAKKYIESYETLAQTMLENARRQRERILTETYQEAEIIKMEAKDRGYEEGKSQGYEDGYKEAYEPTLQKALAEAEEIHANASAVLHAAKEEQLRYLTEKQEEVKDLVLAIAETVLRTEVKNMDAINNMLFKAIQEAKGTKNFIIKCNGNHVSEIKNKIETWKEQMAFQGEIFVIEDKMMEIGNAVVEKDSGKIVVGIEYALEKIKEMLLEE